MLSFLAGEHFSGRGAESALFWMRRCKKSKAAGKRPFSKKGLFSFQFEEVVPSGRRAVSSRNAIPSVCCVTGSGFRRSPLRLSG